MSSVDRVAAEAAAVRYMAGRLCGVQGYPCAVIFVSVNHKNPDSALLRRLGDLKALPLSRVEYFAERPGDVSLQSRDKTTKLQGQLVEIIAVRRDKAGKVDISVRYGTASSILHLEPIQTDWTVVGENITAITVA